MDDTSLSHLVAVTGPAGTSNGVLAAAVASLRNTTAGSGAVILVEGMSDRNADEALAERQGRDLAQESVFVVPMGGATNIGHFLDLFGPRGLGVTLAGLCDEGEEDDILRGLARAGLHPGPARADAERLGFYVCVADLEDEMIRSLGTARVEQLIAAQGELTSFRTFCRQPAQRNRSRQQQLRRFMGTRSGRKLRYARALACSLDPGRVPRPLDGVLTHV